MVKRTSKKAFYILLLYALVLSTFLGYTKANGPLFDNIRAGLSIVLLSVSILSVPKIWTTTTDLYRILIIVFILSIVSALTQSLQGVPLNYTLGTTITWSSVFIVGYLLSIKRIKERVIIDVLLVLGFATIVIQIWQLLNPGSALFGYRGDLDTISLRNGIERFSVGSSRIAFFCLCYYWARLVQKINVKDLLLFALFCFSLYMYLTRQLMVAAAVTLLFTPLFLSKNKNSNGSRYRTLFAIVLLFGILYYFSDSLFGDLIDTGQADGSVDLRMLSIPFFWEKSIEDPLLFILGHGGYTVMEEDWLLSGYVTVSDVGIVGTLYQYGLLAVIAFIIYLIKVFLNHKEVPLYCRLFVFSCIPNILFIFPYRNPIEAFVWMSVCYIMSKSIERERLHG